MGSRTRDLRRCSRHGVTALANSDLASPAHFLAPKIEASQALHPLLPFLHSRAPPLPQGPSPPPRPRPPLEAPPLTSELLESPRPLLSLLGKQDLDVGHLFPEAVAGTGGGFLGKSEVWGSHPGAAGLLDVLGAGVGRAGPGGVEL